MNIIDSIHKIDIILLTWIKSINTHRWIVLLFLFITKTGDGWLYVLTMLYYWWQQGWFNQFVQCVSLAFIVERGAYFLLKRFFKRLRPEHILPNFKTLVTPPDFFSFPSGHTSAVFIFVPLIMSFYPELTILVWLWSLLVGASRLILGVHFPSDILAGAILGVSCALLSMSIILP